MTQTSPVRTNHHCAFSRGAVHELCEEDPIEFFDAIRVDPEGLLETLWNMTRLHEYDMDIPIHGIDTDETQVCLCAIHGHPAAVFTMPTPMALDESHLIAVVLTGFQRTYRRGRPIAFRYFTLNKAAPAHGRQRTALVEWVNHEKHLHGDGPEPTIPAWIAAVERVLAGCPSEAM